MGKGGEKLSVWRTMPASSALPAAKNAAAAGRGTQLGFDECPAARKSRRVAI
jgi:hypothetical protein